MTQLLSTPETSQVPWEPDTSLLDAARGSLRSSGSTARKQSGSDACPSRS